MERVCPTSTNQKVMQGGIMEYSPEGIPLLPEINEQETIRRAESKLEEYHRWKIIACESLEQKITQSFTIEPRGGGGPSKQVEKLGIRRADATSELEAIEQSISNIFDTDYRCILINRYVRQPKLQHNEIARLLHVENTRYFEMRNMALLAFAEQYRNAVLVVEKRRNCGEIAE